VGTLAAALAWAQRGFPVFPLRENDKEPAVDDWVASATTDANAIRGMWVDPVFGIERNYNIGCLCNDMVVVDIDVKKGKDGYNEYMQAQGHFDTLVVQTPSGGWHCYFLGPDSSNASISSSVDIRSHNGFVVAPGSTIDGVPYSVINDRPLSWVPITIERMLKPPYVRAETAEVHTVDTEAAIQAGIRFLESAPPAIEGQRGDETTFITAARLIREMALSPATAFALMRDYYNPRCEPPWALDELYAKVENAAQYGSATHGVLTPEVQFAGVNVAAPPSVFQQLDSSWGNAISPDRIAPRPWLMDRALMHGAVTILMAAGSAGKSSMSLALAAHLALGKDFAGFKARRAAKTIVYNGEDDIPEQSRRLIAVCMAYQLDYQQVKSQIMLRSSRDIKMTLVTNEMRKPVRNKTLVEQLTQECKDPDVGLLILDPLVKIHHCDESDNVQMDAVMETLTDIAHASNIAILALHHTTKGGNGDQRTGNMDIARGASAIVNAARIGFTLLSATQADAEEYGMQDEERHTWVRLDDAKMNLALASQTATWFKREGVKIPSTDIVGVMHYSDKMVKGSHHLRNRIAKLLIATMTANGSGFMTMPQAVATIKAGEPLYANKTDTDIRRKVEGMFSIALEIEGRTLKCEREMSDKDKKSSDKIIIVMR
jgi:hypothetical protein